MPATLHTLDYVILLCQDLAHMRAFYHDVLGLPVEGNWENWMEMWAGTVLLTLRRRGRPYDGLGTQGAAVRLAIRVAPAEVDAWYGQLLQKGVHILEPPADQVFGNRTLYFRDPEGKILEIYAEI
jgi:catechol 2,3-dioxygenase-like lactoylglutathione lyase family enzyme